jgi:hypothetical protein
MEKILVANVSSKVSNDTSNTGKRSIEFELTELNKHLSEGWEIKSSEIVTNQIAYNFSIIYRLVK